MPKMVTERDPLHACWDWKSWLFGVNWVTGTMNCFSLHLGPLMVSKEWWRWTAEEWALMAEREAQKWQELFVESPTGRPGSPPDTPAGESR